MKTASTLLLICLLGQAAHAQKKIEIEVPKQWRGETIELPPEFAKDMKWTGMEQLQFAPGMMSADAKDFFSYVFVLEIDEKHQLDEKSIRREMLAYYRGLCQAVWGRDAESVEVDKFEFKIEPVKLDPKALKPKAPIATKRFIATLKWIEPFQTRKSQTLNIELDVWQNQKTKKKMLFVCVSPSKSNADIWKDLRGIRKKFLATQK